jgi:hypothetical protein
MRAKTRTPAKTRTTARTRAVSARADQLRKLAENDEVVIETRLDPKSPKHRTVIWIVPTDEGIYVRSVRGTRGRWYREATANPAVIIHAGRRKAAAWAEAAESSAVIKAVNRAYQEKYGERWPDDIRSMLKPSVLHTTIQLTPRKMTER